MEYESLYEFFRVYLSWRHTCPKCGKEMWTSYAEGHVADRCFDCGYDNITCGGKEMNIPGYIGDYPVPSEPLPDFLEVREFETRYSFDLPHEKYYRMIRGCGEMANTPA